MKKKKSVKTWWTEDGSAIIVRGQVREDLWRRLSTRLDLKRCQVEKIAC